MDRNASNRRGVLSSVLRDILVEARFTQAGLARISGVSRETVKLIIGEQTVPKPTTLRLLADGAATDGAGNRDAARAAVYYERLMRAAGYLESPAAPVAATERPPLEVEIAALLAKIPGASIALTSLSRGIQNADEDDLEFVVGQLRLLAERFGADGGV